MGPDDANKFPGADDFGFLPELWEMALIAGDQVVRAGGVGAFQENVIGEFLRRGAAVVDFDQANADAVVHSSEQRGITPWW